MHCIKLNVLMTPEEVEWIGSCLAGTQHVSFGYEIHDYIQQYFTLSLTANCEKLRPIYQTVTCTRGITKM